MKRILSLALTILMLVSLAACGTPAEGSPTNEPEATAAPTAAPTESTELAPTTYEDEELARAVELGIGEYCTDDPAVTYPAFFAMLDRAVELIDETRLAEWQGALPEARASSQEINRGNAMCAMFSLAEFLGGEFYRDNNSDVPLRDVPGPWDTNEWQLDDYWGDTMRFPMGFDGITEPNDWNFGGMAYYYSQDRIAAITEMPLFDFSESNQSMRCSDALTYQEALLAALRFVESDMQLVPMTDEATRTASLAGDTLQLAAAMPDASWDSLPNWNGVSLTTTAFGEAAGVRSPWFQEMDPTDIASFGFNFIRVPMDTHLYCGIDPKMVSLPKLQNLDSLLDWCATNGIHICLDIHVCFGYTPDDNPDDETLFIDKEQQQSFITFWEMLVERYKDVPNSLLSFNLLNEPGEVDEEAYIALMRQTIDAVRRHTPDRLMFIDMLKWSTEPIYELVGDGVAQSIHWYDPHILTHSHEYLDGDMSKALTWPIYQCKNGICDHDGPLTIQGNFPAGSTVSFSIEDVHKTCTVLLCADGEELYRHEYGAVNVGEDGCISFDADNECRRYAPKTITVTLPSDASVVTLDMERPTESSYVTISAIGLIIGERSYFIRGSDAYWYQMAEGECLPNAVITISPDGTLRCSDEEYFGLMDSSYHKNQLSRYRDFLTKRALQS